MPTTVMRGRCPRSSTAVAGRVTALALAAFVVAGCEGKADVTINADKPGEVKLNGKDAAQVHIEKDGKKLSVNGQPAGNIDVNVNNGKVSVTTGAAPADAKAQAEQIFSQRCSVCHGMDGKGDGPGAAALNPKPRNYTDAKWQASVTDDLIAKTIVEGGAAVGKSPLMVPNADLKDKPDVVKALVAKVRSFKTP